MKQGQSRVAVTGLGVRTPAGQTPKELWNALSAGASTARKITSFDVEGLPVDFACQIHELDAGGYLSAKELKRLDRATVLAFCAAADAVDDAGGLPASPERRAVVAGTGMGAPTTQETVLTNSDERGRAMIRPFHVPMLMPNAAAAAISMRHQAIGPSLTVSSACASGGHAVGEGMRLIREGTADMVIAGGLDACVSPNSLLGFYRCGALSARRDRPERACRPFDADRDGFVLAEGAAFLVLERHDHAVRRNARVYAELVGYGRTSDAYHLVAPRPEGEGAYRCMRAALDDAGRTAGEVAHVNAHGTSTLLNDLGESQAMARMFGPGKVPVTSTKGVTGHGLGAAGAIEAVVSALTIQHGTIHPTANLEDQDPHCEIDVVRAPRALPEGIVLSNSFAFGGHNAVLAFAPAR